MRAVSAGYHFIYTSKCRKGAVLSSLTSSLPVIPAQPEQLVLKWQAQREVFGIRKEWDNSTLISCDAGVMAARLSRAVRAHAFAVTAGGGGNEVTASSEETLAHLGRVVEAVGFLQNRNLTTAYWERVERIMPLREVSVVCSIARTSVWVSAPARLEERTFQRSGTTLRPLF